MKKTYLLILILFSFSQCQMNEDSITFEDEIFAEEPSLLSKTEATDYRGGIYISSFKDEILGDVSEENKMLSWLEQNNISVLHINKLKQILSDAELADKLQIFMKRVSVDYPDISVSFEVGNATCLDLIKEFIDTYNVVPSGIVTEIEFWNSNSSYIEFTETARAMDKLKKIYKIEFDREFYVGPIKNNEGIDKLKRITDYLIANAETIYLTNYSAYPFTLYNSESPYSLSYKLKILAQSAKTKNKQVNVVIVYNLDNTSSDPNIYEYFDVLGENKQFADAHLEFLNELNTFNLENREWINMKGYEIFKYEEAILARP